MSIDKASLLAALACTTAAATVEGFGSVLLRQVSVAENDTIRAKVSPESPRSLFGLLLVAASVVNEDGTRVFTDDDVAALGQASGRKIDALVQAVLDANGYGKETPGNAPASGPTPSAASASASPSPSA